MIGKALLVMKNFYESIFFLNNTSALLIFKKSIFKITLTLMSISKKVFWKNLGQSALFFT